MGKFRIKITAWWASADYIQYKYSTNGIFWHRIYKCEYEILDEWYYMKPRTDYYSNAKYVIDEFKSVDDIRKYEDNQRAMMIKYNAEIKAIKDRHKKDRNDVYNKFS